jgi:hypothetical protein
MFCADKWAAMNAEDGAAALGACEQDLAEGAPETVYGLFWVDYDCSLLAGKFPEALHPLMCDARVRAYRAADFDKVVARLARLGHGVPASVFAERGVKEKLLDHGWRPELER